MHELKQKYSNVNEGETYPEHPSSSSHSSNRINHHTRHASDAVHRLVGVEIQGAHGYAEAKDELHAVDDGTQYHRLHPRSTTDSSELYNPSHRPDQFRETQSLEQPSITDDRLIKNALSIGLLSGSAPIVASSFAGAGASLATGATAIAGLLAAAPLAGGTIGYFAGKEFKHPVLGAATGAALTSAGMLAGLNASLGLSAVASIWPAAVSGALTYGLGEAHNYLWKTEGKPRPGVAGTFLRGIVAPITIPVGLVRKVFWGGK